MRLRQPMMVRVFRFNRIAVRQALKPTSIVLAVWLAASCSTERDRPGAGIRQGDADERKPLSVRALMTEDPASLSLIGKTDKNSEWLAVQISDSLVQYDSQLTLQPRLAKSWEFSEDHLTLTFHLREGVRWHDGREVTAEDVVFSVNKLVDPLVENRSLAPLFQHLIKVESVDPHTIRASYASVSADVLETWRLPLLPRHLAGKDPDLLTGEFARHPVGCGPFRFASYRPGEEIVLEANADYWDGKPQIDRLIFRIFQDQRTAYHALLAGELDIMVASSELWSEAQSSSAADRLRSFVYYGLSAWQVGWNQDGTNPFFRDPRVRRAMVLALDRLGFISKVAGGLARPAATTYHPDLPWTLPAVEPWPYDPAEARRLLEQAGWRDTDGDGIRDRNGRPFHFSLMIPAGTQQIADRMAAWQQQSWAEVGLRAEIEKIEWRLFRQRRNDHQFQAAQGSLLFSPAPDQYDLYHSTARDGGSNYVSFADTQVDRLLERGRTTFDLASRMEVYHQLQVRLHELEPISCLFHFASPVLHDHRLVGIEPSALDLYRTTRGPRVWRWVEGSSES